MEASVATRQMPLRATLIADHTEAVKEWDPDEQAERIVGYYSCWRVTCRIHAAATDCDTKEEARRWATSPEGFCTECRDELRAWELSEPALSSDVSPHDAERERMERHPREGRTA